MTSPYDTDLGPTLIPDAMRTIRMNQTPLCHRTLTPDPHPRYLFDRTRISDAELAELAEVAASPPGGIVAVSDPAAITRLGTGSPCIGSRCALWVGMPGKNGICADNPDRIRDDPAVGDAKEK